LLFGQNCHSVLSIMVCLIQSIVLLNNPAPFIEIRQAFADHIVIWSHLLLKL